MFKLIKSVHPGHISIIPSHNGHGVRSCVKGVPVPVCKRSLNTSCPCKLAQSSLNEACPAHPGSAQNGGARVTPETWEAAKPFDIIPGPKSLPIVGNTWRFLPKIGQFYGLEIGCFFEKLHNEFGDIVKLDGIIGLPSLVYVFKPDDIEKIYKQESISPERDILPSMTYFRKNMRQEIFKDARGLVTSNGPEWYHFRNKVNSIMMQPKTVKQYVNTVDKIARELVKKLKKIRGPDSKINVDIMNEVNKWSLESIASIGLDTKLGCLADDLPLDSLPQRMVTIAEKTFNLAFKLDFEPSLWKYVSTPTYRKAMKSYNEQVNMCQYYVSRAIEKRNENKKAGIQAYANQEPSVLDKMLDVDPKVAVVMAIDMMIAGIDTTSVALVNILYYLAINHTKQEILRGEIISQLPQKTSKLTAEHLDNMPYLKACLKEAGRMYPVTAGTMRNVTKDTVLSGYRIPKGALILFPHMYLSVKEDQFPRPLEFIPERWLRDQSDNELYYKNAHPFSSLQFGFGARSCIGRRFAELELQVAVVNFMRNFNLSWDGPPPKRVLSSINLLKGPFNFVFKNNDIEVNGNMACIKNDGIL